MVSELSSRECEEMEVTGEERDPILGSDEKP